VAGYSVRITKTAEKQIDGLSDALRRAVVGAIQALPLDPRPRGCRKLAGHSDVFRIRVGRYRILYEVYDDVLVVLILKVGHRKDVYR